MSRLTRTHDHDGAVRASRPASAFGGAALAMVARLLGTVATAIGVILTASSLSGGEFGAYALATGIVGVIVVAADLGMTQSLMRAHVEGRSTRRLVLGAAAMRVAVTAGAGGAIAAGFAATGRDAATLVLAVTVLGVAQSISGMATGLLAAQRRPRLLAATALARPILELVGFAVIAALQPSALGFVLVSIVAAGTVATIAGAATIRGTPARSDAPRTLRDIARYGRYLALITLMWSASLQVDQVVIATMHGAAAVATYAFVWKVLMVLTIGVISAAAVVAPWVADPTSPGRIRSTTFAAWHRAIIIASASLAGCMAVVGPGIVRLINPDFVGDALLAAALAPALVMLGSAAFSSACLGYLGARGRMRPAVELIVSNLALDLLLVPWLGAWGAAIATNIVLVRWAIAHHRLVVAKLEQADPSVEVDGMGMPILAGLLTSASIVIATGLAVRTLLEQVTSSDLLVVTGAAIAVTAVTVARLVPVARHLRGLATRDHWLVLHLADYRAPYPGTFIRQFEVLAAELATRGGRVALAIPHDAAAHPWARELSTGDQIDLHVLPAHADRGGIAGRVRVVRNLLRDVQPDVVQTHFSTFDVPTGIASMQLMLGEGWRPRLVWYYRTTIEGDARDLSLARRIKDRIRFRIIGAPVDVITTISDGMAEQVAQRGARRIEVVRGGCDTAHFRPLERNDAASTAARRCTRSRLGVGDDDVLLLHMGWHWILKGGDVLDSVVGMSDGLVDANLGGGRLVAVSVGMPSGVETAWVEPLDQVTDIRELLLAADVFMAVSRWEAFGNSLVEAMSSGLVAIASDAPGHELTARTAPGVWMAPAGSLPETAAALEGALAQRANWVELGAENRRHVIADFDITRWARDLACVHERLAGADGRARSRRAPGSPGSGDDDGTGDHGRDVPGAIADLQVEREATG